MRAACILGASVRAEPTLCSRRDVTGQQTHHTPLFVLYLLARCALVALAVQRQETRSRRTRDIVVPVDLDDQLLLAAAEFVQTRPARASAGVCLFI